MGEKKVMLAAPAVVGMTMDALVRSGGAVGLPVDCAPAIRQEHRVFCNPVIRQIDAWFRRVCDAVKGGSGSSSSKACCSYVCPCLGTRSAQIVRSSPITGHPSSFAARSPHSGWGGGLHFVANSLVWVQSLKSNDTRASRHHIIRPRAGCLVSTPPSLLLDSICASPLSIGLFLGRLSRPATPGCLYICTVPAGLLSMLLTVTESTLVSAKHPCPCSPRVFLAF